MPDIDYLASSAPQKWRIRTVRALRGFPHRAAAAVRGFPARLSALSRGVRRTLLSLGVIFLQGDLATRLSFAVMGFGCLRRGRIGRGLFYLLFQIGFWCYFFTVGLSSLASLATLGENVAGEVWNAEKGIYEYTAGDNSMLILLYGTVSVLILLLHTLVWISSVKACRETEILARTGGKIPRLREEITELLNGEFHKTLLFLPTLAVIVFTVLPLVFMILIAFTNYDRFHMPPGNLFTWVGGENFRAIFGLGENALLGRTFRSILAWTLVWAAFATLSNYIFGMLLALLIGRRGIRGKKLFRSVFVTTIAIPQFVSLMFMRNLLADTGLVNVFLQQMGWITAPIPFLTDGMTARFTVLAVNMWVGIPYSMLITTGILLNIPRDLYEASRIDGASPLMQFRKITLPYVLYVTAPYLITQFVGNINNFNVIWLLSGGGPMTGEYYQAGRTDLLITWLYRITTGQQNYKLASVIGIITFAVCAAFSLAVYSRTASAGEGDFG